MPFTCKSNQINAKELQSNYAGYTLTYSFEEVLAQRAHSANSRSCPSSATVSCAILADGFRCSSAIVLMHLGFRQERGCTTEERTEAKSGFWLPFADPLATIARRACRRASHQ